MAADGCGLSNRPHRENVYRASEHGAGTCVKNEKLGEVGAVMWVYFEFLCGYEFRREERVCVSKFVVSLWRKTAS